MYSESRLDTPPPTSQFRRPWSPDPNEPLQSGLNTQIRHALYDDYSPQRQQYTHGQDHLQFPQRQWLPREGSDVSVEALDLADYARTLRVRQNEDPYPPFTHQDVYPPRPLHSLTSRDSLQVPSLISRGETLSSNTHSTSSLARNPVRRPFSLPPSSYQPSSRNTYTVSSPQAGRLPYLAEPQIHNSSEIDVSQFPAWSRSWYQSNITGFNPSFPPQSNPLKRSPFDPGYISRDGQFYPQYNLNSSSGPYSYAPASSLGHTSTRDLLPWSKDPPDHGPPVDGPLKEERMRMLEREFGAKGKGKGRGQNGAGDFLDENGKPLIGTVDAKGNLVTQGPMKRAATRFLQVLLALTAAVPSIYAALVIKSKEVPPPAGKPPAFVLYILSMLTCILLFYLFLFRPCCCAPTRRKGPGSRNPLANGMMVLPVQGLPGGKKRGNKKAGRKGRQGKGSGAGMGDVQVNLIVDPHAFGGKEDEDSEEDDGEDEWGDGKPGAYGSGDMPGRQRRRRTRRRSVFAGLAMEEEWKQARAWARKMAYVDVAGLALWGAVFVFILIGKRCPSGGFGGWCNAYNVSSAAACLLCIAFGVSTFFDVKDLNTSKASPRTRT